MARIVDFFGRHAWVAQIFLVVLLTLVVNVILALIFRQLSKHAERTQNIWDNTIPHALKRPLTCFIWLLGISYAVQITGNSLVAHRAEIFHLIPPIRQVGSIVLIAWAVLRFIKSFETLYIARELPKENFDKTTVRAVGQILRMALLISTVLIVLQTLGIKLSVFLAFGGFGTIAMGFAAKDTLANFFGGLMIYFERPFKIGDWIRSPDKNIEGTVENIGWRSTCIRTFDKRPLYVPNGIFSTIAIENPSRMTNRRIKTTVGVRYDDADKLATIIENVDAMLRVHPDIDTAQTLFVNMTKFGSSALEFTIYAFTKTTVWVTFQAVQQDVFLKVIDIIIAEGAECAFPTQTLHLPKGVNINSALEQD